MTRNFTLLFFNRFRIILLSSLLLPGLTGVIVAQEHRITASSKIKQVTVFLNGGQVDRTARVALYTGLNSITLKDLSSKIDEESIQATVDGNVRIVSVDYGARYFSDSNKGQNRTQEIKDSVTVLKRSRKELAYQLETYKAEKNMLEANNKLGESLSVNELRELSDFYGQRLLEVNRRIFQAEELKEKLDRRITFFETRLKRTQTTSKGKKSHFIELKLYAAQKTDINIEIKYLVGGAGWAPKYNVRVADINEEITIEYDAQVMNQTGENWENVQLILSSSVPTKSQEKPSLDPWGLSHSNREDQEGRLNRHRANKTSGDNKESDPIATLEGVEYSQIEVSALGTEFKIKHLNTIPSDSKPYLVEVNKYKLPASYKYQAIPKVDQDAFLLAQVAGWEELNLIEGQTNIYFRGTYVGHSYIKPQYAGDTLDISLGRDSKIILNRTKVEDKNTRQVVGLHRKEEMTYKISARNTNTTPVTISLLDQVPVAQDGDIEVEVKEISDASLEKLSGTLTWDFKLEPGEAEEFTVSFVVKYPKNKDVHLRKNRNIRYSPKFREL